MSAQAYAKIDMTNPGNGTGTVVNTQMIDIDAAQNTLDQNFTWIAITGLYCIDGSGIQIDCVYDGTNFYPPPA